MIYRHYLDASIEILRHQFGENTVRPEYLPEYEGRRVVAHKPGQTLVTVFNLLGFGRTKDAAEQMGRVMERKNL